MVNEKCINNTNWHGTNELIYSLRLLTYLTTLTPLIFGIHQIEFLAHALHRCILSSNFPINQPDYKYKRAREKGEIKIIINNWKRASWTVYQYMAYKSGQYRKFHFNKSRLSKQHLFHSLFFIFILNFNFLLHSRLPMALVSVSLHCIFSHFLSLLLFKYWVSCERLWLWFMNKSIGKLRNNIKKSNIEWLWAIGIYWCTAAIVFFVPTATDFEMNFEKIVKYSF